MIPIWFVYVAIAIRLVSGALYVKSVVKGSTRPDPVTWFFWGLTPLIAFAAQISKGFNVDSLMTLTLSLGPLVIFLAAFAKHRRSWIFTRSAAICAIFAMLGIVLWQITDDPILATLFSIFADISASTPTVIKAYKKPNTECAVAYLISMGSMVLTLLTVTDWTFTNYGFTVYIFMINFVIWSAIHLGRARTSVPKRHKN